MGDQARRTRVEHLPAEELTRILGQLGHEVGTPLGSLLMMAEMIADAAADPGLRRRAEGIKQAATEIREVVQPFVRLLRLRTGWLGPEPAEVRGEDVSRAIGAGADSAGVPLTVATPLPDGRVDLDFVRDAAACCCSWAAERSADAALSLVGEGGEGGEGGERRSILRCELRCRGKEVPWHEPALLDPLGAGQLALSRRHGGAGLQLALARMLAWRMGGQLTGRFDPVAGENLVILDLPVVSVDPLD